MAAGHSNVFTEENSSNWLLQIYVHQMCTYVIQYTGTSGPRGESEHSAVGNIGIYVTFTLITIVTL